VKDKAVHYVCSQCGRVETKWLGRCPDCGSWNTFEEEAVRKTSDGKRAVISTATKPVSLDEVEVDPLFRYETGISELDRVLGGGARLLHPPWRRAGYRQVHLDAPST